MHDRDEEETKNTADRQFKRSEVAEPINSRWYYWIWI